MIEVPLFDDLRQGDFVKARIGNERLWFEVLTLVDRPSNAVMCVLASTPACGAVFDGRVTLDRVQILETKPRATPPKLKPVMKPESPLEPPASTG